MNNIIELLPKEFRVVVLEKVVGLILNRKRLIRLEAIDNNTAIGY